MAAEPTLPPPTLQEQMPTLLAHVAGYASHRTIGMGLRQGLIRALAEAAEVSADELAERLDVDPFYTSVWCRAAVAAGICERAGHDGRSRYRLAAHMETLLLDPSSPAYVGGVFTVLEQPEMFDRFEGNLASGERLWWDETSPDWIAEASGTGRPFYTRLVPGGLEQVPGLAERLRQGCTVVDTACGAGAGLIALAEAYPSCRIVGVDGDEQSLDLARKRIRSAEAGLHERTALVHQPLEELRLDFPATLVINNISMHECRDIDRVTENVKAALEPGGWFVISDFPFPDSDEGLRSVPGRIMTGIQYFEAQIDDQLLPRAAYDELLRRHGFTELGSFTLTPMHAVTHARR